MPDFIQTFRQKGDLSFLGMRNSALSLLPSDIMERNRLYNDLKRGTGILDDDDHLNMYLHSFGKMHKAKLDAAFRSIPNPNGLFESDIEIYDWGCGQGTATICLFDFIRENGIEEHINSITFIDPSVAAVNRASEVVGCYGTYYINEVTKSFDDLTVDDFPKSNNKKLHLFSNILDVEAFDLAQFIQLFQNSCNGENFFICVGPYR